MHCPVHNSSKNSNDLWCHNTVNVLQHLRSLDFTLIHLMQMLLNSFLIFARFCMFVWNLLDRQLTKNITFMTTCLPFQLTVHVFYLPFKPLSLQISVQTFCFSPSEVGSALPDCCPAVYYLILSFYIQATCYRWAHHCCVFNLWLFFCLICHWLLSPSADVSLMWKEKDSNVFSVSLK